MIDAIYLLPLVSYLYGSIPFGFLMAKWVRGVDIRDTGSGNIGATNAARTLGFKFFPLIFLLDFSKGFLPALIAVNITAGISEFSPSPLTVLCSLSAILGHIFPVFLRFKGGKAVAAGAGAFFVLAPVPVLIASLVWALSFAFFRYVSLASMMAAATLGVTVWFPQLNENPSGSGIFLSAFATFSAVFIIMLHRTNIKRLISGNEHKIGNSAD